MASVTRQVRNARRIRDPPSPNDCANDTKLRFSFRCPFTSTVRAEKHAGNFQHAFVQCIRKLITHVFICRSSH